MRKPHLPYYADVTIWEPVPLDHTYWCEHQTCARNRWGVARPHAAIRVIPNPTVRYGYRPLNLQDKYGWDRRPPHYLCTEHSWWYHHVEDDYNK